MKITTNSHRKALRRTGRVCLAFFASLWFFSCSKRESEQKKIKEDFASLAAALAAYQQECGTFPTTSQGLQPLVQKPTTIPIPRRWSQKIAALPTDPWGNPYVYRYPGAFDSTIYEVISTGPDGKQNFHGSSTDDISSQNPTTIEALVPSEAEQAGVGLTTAKAQRAFNKLNLGPGVAVVKGVRLNKGKGPETVDLNLTNFQYLDTFQKSKSYSGAAEATFQGYTDGHWTLKEMHFFLATAESANFTYDLDIE